MARIYEDNSLSIGNTPLVRLNRVNDGATIWAKIEGRNPAYSVKCRIGSAMIWDAEKRGTLKAGMTIVASYWSSDSMDWLHSGLCTNAHMQCRDRVTFSELAVCDGGTTTCEFDGGNT